MDSLLSFEIAYLKTSQQPQTFLCKSDTSIPAGTVLHKLDGSSPLHSFKLINTFTSTVFLTESSEQTLLTFRKGTEALLYSDPKCYAKQDVPHKTFLTTVKDISFAIQKLCGHSLYFN